MNEGKTYIVHMTEANVVCRVPLSLRGKPISVISLGICNFKCPYCYIGGGVPRHANPMIFPHARLVSIKTVEKFIVTQAEKGNIIKISGGEPTILPELTDRLIQVAKDHGARVFLDSTGWNPETIKMLINKIDLLALDIKGPKRCVEKITGTNRSLCWDSVIRSISIARNQDCVLEIRTPIFGFTNYEDLLELVHLIPKQAFWVIRRFISGWVPFDKYYKSNYSVADPLLKNIPSWLTVPSDETIKSFYRRLLTDEPTLKGRLVVLLGSPRESTGMLL